MNRLLNIEILKLKRYRAFLIMGGLYFFTILMAVLFFEGIIIAFFREEGLPFGVSINVFPRNWHMLSYIASIFNFVLAVLVIMLIANEFSFKTARQSIINGQSREEFILSKLLLTFVLALAATLVVFVGILTIGFISSSPEQIGQMLERITFILAYLFKLLGYLSIASFIAFLVRKTGLALIIYLLYTWVFEDLLIYLLGLGDAGDYLPANAFSALLPLPIKEAFLGAGAMNGMDFSQLVVALVYLALLWGGTYVLFKRRDL